MRNQRVEAGCANPVSRSRLASRMAENASRSNLFNFHWRESLSRGSSALLPMPHTGSRGLAVVKRLLPVLTRWCFIARFWVNCGTGDWEPGVPTRSHFRELIHEWPKPPHRANFFPLHWCGSLGRGSSAPRPMPQTGSRGLASVKRCFMAGVCVNLASFPDKIAF